ncbi:MAG TPA: hypothetical protein VJS69_10845 [Candidatus Krumholzibacteria bacterium]|nr:hypothetical protein [Candidatus Krumholzibacteria bacterium]
MKRALLLFVSLLLISSVAMADHIGIYSDASGSSCVLAPGFTTSAVVVHKFTTGTTGSLFGISTAHAPGSAIFSFSSPYETLCINPPCPYSYGACVQSIVVGTITGILVAGGYLEVVGAGTLATPVALDCSQADHPATGGRGLIASSGDCEPLAVENSTWGSVKALYR